MGKAEGGDEAYFRRSSLFWCTVITVSFGYYTDPGSWKEVMAQLEAGRAAAAYFRTARPWSSLVTVLALGYFGWVVLWPESIPYETLGSLGRFTLYLIDNHPKLLHGWYWLAWMIHVGESLYALILCKSKGITSVWAQFLWFLQTFLFGIASLSLLLAYKPKRQKRT